MRTAFCVLLLSFSFSFTSPLAGQQQPQPVPPGQMLSPEQLDELVAPIALYPDPLISQILVASTYPLELVQAGQWLQRNPGLNGAALTQAAQQQNWDPSVQALVVFPDLVKRLNQDVTWITNLGNAFLGQEGEVLDSVQRMRARAQQSGRLASTSQQTVTTASDAGQSYIEIEPSDPQMMYLPDYDPAFIWGPSRYYPYANWYYTPSYFGFGIGISIGSYFGGGWGGWGNWGWSPGWGGRTIFVNNNFIHRYNFNSRRGGSLQGRGVWSHDSFHRRAVPYSTPSLSNRYGGGIRRAVPSNRSNFPSPPRGETRPSRSDRVGNRQIPSAAPNRNPSAFGGVRDGGAARTQSDQGFGSLGPGRTGAAARGPESRPAPSPRTERNNGGGQRQERRGRNEKKQPNP